MCQFFLNACFYTKQKISLMWPNMSLYFLVRISQLGVSNVFFTCSVAKFYWVDFIKIVLMSIW